MAIDISDPRYDDYAPDESAPRCTILPIIGDDDTTIEGWAAFADGEQVTRITLVCPSKAAAAQAAEDAGYAPWMDDEEIDAEHEALEHGNWPF